MSTGTSRQISWWTIRNLKTWRIYLSQITLDDIIWMRLKLYKIPFCYRPAQCSCFLSKQRQQAHQRSATYGLESVKTNNNSVNNSSDKLFYKLLTMHLELSYIGDNMYLRYLLFRQTFTLSTECSVSRSSVHFYNMTNTNNTYLYLQLK